MGLESLESRTNAFHYFMFDLLFGRVDASNILPLINISVPPVSYRHYRFLVSTFHRTNYGVFEPLNNMIMLFNSIFENSILSPQGNRLEEIEDRVIHFEQPFRLSSRF